MAKACSYCGNPLPTSYRLRRKHIHPECAQEVAAIKARYENRLLRAANSLTLTEDTKSDLNQLASDGKFAPEPRFALNRGLYYRLGKSFLEDSYLSVEERAFLSELQLYFGLSDKEADAAKMDKIRELTVIAEGNLPVIKTSVRLQKGETAHYEGLVKWSHLVTKKRRVAGTRGTSVRIAKGVRIPISGTPGRTEEWEEYQTVDKGKTVITSKRLLFFGSKKNFNVKHEKVVEIDYYEDGVKINRGLVKPTYFFMDDPSYFYVILSTVLEGSET